MTYRYATQITEAEEGLIGLDHALAKRTALENLREQRLRGETMGVISMYEEAARAVGATQSECDSARSAQGRKA